MFTIGKIYEKEIPFSGSKWSSEFAKRFILKNNNGKIIEASYFIRYNKNHEIVSVAFEPSLSYGCPIKCLFCASGDIKDISILTKNEIFNILEILIEDYKKTFGYVKEVPHYVGYSGIGEGTLLGQYLIGASRNISEKYDFLIFKIASMAANPDLFLKFADSKLPLRSIQVTLPHYEENKIKYLFSNFKNYSLGNVMESLKEFNKKYAKVTIKINYIGIKNFNDSIECLDKTIELLQKYLNNNFELKLSLLNKTNVSKRNNLIPMKKEELENFLEHCKKYDFRTYLWGSTESEKLTCGELKEDYCNYI